MTHEDYKRALKVALTGALTGGAVGGGARALSSPGTLRELLKAVGTGAAIGGTVAGGSSAIGSKIMGSPTPDESNPAASRGAVGGGVTGALLGGSLGALAVAGHLPAKLGSLAEKLDIPAENMITEYIKKLAQHPVSGKTIAKGAGIGAAALGLPLAYQGFDEGVGYDALQHEIDRKQREKEAMQAMAYQGQYR
jgi:hypothetical protein